MPYFPGHSSVALNVSGNLSGTADALSFIGAGVTATIATGVLTVEIPGGGGGGAGALILSGSGGPAAATATLLYISGSGASVSITNSTATLNVPVFATASAIAVQVTGTSVLTDATTLNFFNVAGFPTASVAGNVVTLTMSFPSHMTDWDSSGNLMLESYVSGVVGPAVPPAGNLTIFSRKKAGRTLLNWVGPAGVDIAVQPNLFLNKVHRFNPSPGSNSITVGADGLVLVTSGTATARAISGTAFSTSLKRVAWVSTAVSGAATGYSMASPLCFMGTGTAGFGPVTGMGGFYYVSRFFPGQTAAANLYSFFVGLVTGTGASYIANGQNINPSGVINQIGVGYNRTDTTWKIFHGANTTTTVDTGIPIQSASLTSSANHGVYELRMFAAPSSNTCSISFEKINPNTPALFEYVASSTLPTGVLLTICGRAATMTTTAVSLELVGLYLETDY
jgi:hypothetical protein